MGNPKGPAAGGEGAAGGIPMVGNSPAICDLREQIAVVAKAMVPVLISGESGSGKELVAKALHVASERRDEAFVAINCAAFPETLVEDELFGHERGAFTGAHGRREGLFRAADRGTLLLDEVADLSLRTQAKLLRVLQEGTMHPVGSDSSVKVDIRFLSACNTDLKESVIAGRFREDLYYRLKVVELHVAPLRERAEDLVPLVAHFLEKHGDPSQPAILSEDAYKALQRYDFPGNVRELEHAIRHGLALSGDGDVIEEHHLPHELRSGTRSSAPPRCPAHLADAVAQFERAHILSVLEEKDGCRTTAAQALGISRKNLWEKLKRYGIRGGAPTRSVPSEDSD